MDMGCVGWTLALLALTGTGSADLLRGRLPGESRAEAAHAEVSVVMVQQTLDAHLKGIRGAERASLVYLPEIAEAVLQPMFAALPKNGEGLLGHAVARYALRRYFASRHGWSMRGLSKAGGDHTASSPSRILQGNVSHYVQEVFEHRLNGRGLGIRDLAALAATLEHLVYDDAVTRLQAVYRAFGLPVESGSSKERVLEAIDALMAAFVLGQDVAILSEEEIRAELAAIPEAFPAWGDTRDLVRDAYRNATRLSGHCQTADFDTARLVVATVQDHYRAWQERGCKDLRRALLMAEERDNGRVRLPDFYGTREAADLGWQFSDTVDDLRRLGALDESNPQQPRVLIANYMSSAANCFAGTGFYSVCCIDECDDILGQIERRLAAPVALPREVALVVASVPSPTVAAPRELTASLLRRLDDLAARHSGQVPLHGRLFAHWLHHAFPRECPYPHASGLWTREESIMERGGDVATTEEEVEGVPWSNEGDVVHVTRQSPTDVAGHARAITKWLLLLAVFVAMMRAPLSDSLALWGPLSAHPSAKGVGADGWYSVDT